MRCHSPDEAAASILAPKLHTAIFDARPTSIDEPTFEILDRGAGSWLSKFAQCAWARQSALREIRVNIFALVREAVSQESVDIEHINECLDNLEEARQQADQVGIEISYVKCPSRQDYQAYHERIQSGEEEIWDPLKHAFDGVGEQYKPDTGSSSDSED